MPTVAERISVVEVQVVNLDEKLDEIKVDVKEMHDCLDRTGTDLKATLKEMHNESCRQHNELAGKIGELEKFKAKWTYMIAGAIAVVGFASGHVSALTKLFG
jgi:lipid II:glycine glycyltransferase (peptidoglycan interpeptide bridge formation enzyme)